MKNYQPQSAGPVRYPLTGHLWTDPHLSVRDKSTKTSDKCIRTKRKLDVVELYTDWNIQSTMQAQKSLHGKSKMLTNTYLSRPLDIAVHE